MPISRPLLPWRILLLAWLAAYLVAKPGLAVAQLGVPSDPICRLRMPSNGAPITGPFEYDVKAAMLYRCVELVQWPSETSRAKPPTLTIGLLGKNLFGESLNCLIGKTVSGRKLLVKKVSGLKAAARCQLVFVCSSESKRTSNILKALAGLPVLTIGEIPGFAEQGGMINLLVEGNNIRLEINPNAAQRAHLVLDHKLMEITQPVPDPSSAASGSTGS